jgi:D-glycero-D-manno-heptose 1,7-bisphosphate phosphatase
MARVTRSLNDFRLCIFDADGTLRRTTVPGQPCPRASSEWELIDGVRETLQAIDWSGREAPRLALASNQDQVGAGLFTEETARRLLRSLARAATGIVPPDEAIQFCPHALGVDCQCRKPKPAMLQRIMAFYGIGPEATVLVGDSDDDRGAAAAAGVTFRSAASVFGWAQPA